MNNQATLSPELTASPAPLDTLKTLSPLQSQRVLLPDHQSTRTKALLACKRIDHVEVRGSTKINGHTHFIVQVFNKKPQSNIPTLQQDRSPDSDAASSSRSGIPDAIFYHRFSQLVNLRHEAYFHANTGHASTRSCSFCSSMTQLLYDGPTLPRLHMKLFHGDASICNALEGFLNSLLQITSTLSTTPPNRMCDGQHEIPVMLHKFFSVVVDDKQPSQSTTTQGVRKAKQSSVWSF